MQSFSSRIWTRVAVSISYDDNHYTTGTSIELLFTVKSITIVIQYIYKYKYRRKQAGLCCSDTNGLLTSDFGSSTRWESHNSHYTNHTIWHHPKVRRIPWCLRSQFIFADRDPKNLTAAATVETSTLSHHGPISTLNWPFFKILKFSTQW